MLDACDDFSSDLTSLHLNDRSLRDVAARLHPHVVSLVKRVRRCARFQNKAPASQIVGTDAETPRVVGGVAIQSYQA